MLELQSARADQFISRHVCARCYGYLSKQHADEWDIYIVICPNCGPTWGGAVIRLSTAIKMGEIAATELLEVKVNLREFFPREKRSTDQVLRELGF